MHMYSKLILFNIYTYTYIHNHMNLNLKKYIHFIILLANNKIHYLCRMLKTNYTKANHTKQKNRINTICRIVDEL